MDRPVDTDDIQGNVFGGFNTDVQLFLGFTVGKETGFDAAAAWLAARAGEVTTMAQVRSQRADIKSKQPGAAPTWLFLAVGSRIMARTQPDAFIPDQGFNLGMPARAPGLGDRTDPSRWRVGATGVPLDVLAVVASNSEAAATARSDALRSSAEAAGLSASYIETGRRIPGDREHFGFRDGLSQPTVAGVDEGGTLQPGEFVFGYPRVPGGPAVRAPVDGRGITDNGSLVVFRRLRQDVAAFRAFCAGEAARVSPQWPGISAEHVAALIVGRWPSGALAAASRSTDPGPSPQDNEFDFAADFDGHHCPLAAHIRKVNPRRGRKDKGEVPRILRRGIPFGQEFGAGVDVERGLLFVAMQTSIKQQFEFLVQMWMNSPQNPAPGNDLLVGVGDSPEGMDVLGPKGWVRLMRKGHQWIEPTGGGYLFAPGRAGLAKFATPPSTFGLWRPKKYWAMGLDVVKGAMRH